MFCEYNSYFEGENFRIGEAELYFDFHGLQNHLGPFQCLHVSWAAFVTDEYIVIFDRCYPALLALELARQMGQPTPLLATANELLNACRGLGIDHRDFVTVYDVYCHLGGMNKWAIRARSLIEPISGMCPNFFFVGSNPDVFFLSKSITFSKDKNALKSNTKTYYV